MVETVTRAVAPPPPRQTERKDPVSAAAPQGIRRKRPLAGLPGASDDQIQVTHRLLNRSGRIVDKSIGAELTQKASWRPAATAITSAPCHRQLYGEMTNAARRAVDQDAFTRQRHRADAAPAAADSPPHARDRSHELPGGEERHRHCGGLLMALRVRGLRARVADRHANVLGASAAALPPYGKTRAWRRLRRRSATSRTSSARATTHPGEIGPEDQRESGPRAAIPGQLLIAIAQIAVRWAHAHRVHLHQHLASLQHRQWRIVIAQDFRPAKACC